MQTFSLSTEFVRMWGLFNTRIVVTQRFFFVVIGGGVSSIYLANLAELPKLLKFVLILLTGFGWIAASLFILIKTMPWVVGAFALLLRPFDKLLDRGLEAGESYLNRETGQVSFAMPAGKQLTAPFGEFDAYVERVIEAGGIFYRLMFVHRYTAKQFSQTSLSRVEPTKEEVMALWDMLQRYMDTSQPLPDVPRLEPFRHLDPVTAEYDERIERNPRFWRDLDLEAWRQGEGYGSIQWVDDSGDKRLNGRRSGGSAPRPGLEDGDRIRVR